jgi:hypothetical protein
VTEDQQDTAIEMLKRERMRLISVIPVRTSLEDYFVSKLKTPKSEAHAGVGA